MELYFDSSVYGYIDDLSEAKSVRRWLAYRRHTLVASDEANIGEAVRIHDTNARASRVMAIFRAGARLARTPADMVSADELLKELARVRPAWIKAYPTLKSRSDYLQHRRQTVWDELRRDATFVPPAANTVFPILDRVIGENKAAQKARRQAVLAGRAMNFVAKMRPDLTSVMNSYTPLECYIRYQLYIDWTHLLQQRVVASAEVDWLAPHLDLNEMLRDVDTGPWLDFWFREADPSRMPATVLSILIEKQQDQYKINAGNTLDRVHGTYLQMVDRVVTADVDFHDAMLYAAGLVHARGAPILIKGSATSVVAELRAAVR